MQHVRRRGVVLIGALFLVALAIRSYRLSADPLWFDELFGYQVGELGLIGIIRSPLFSPHPPLFYLIQWMLAGFGYIHTEWAWRWLSVVAGSATIPFIYVLARSVASRFAATIATVLFILSPAHIYFSQESRPYALVTLLSAASAWLTLRLEQQPGKRQTWLALILLSFVGLWTSYTYVLVVGIQVLFLGITLRFRRAWLTYVGVLILICLPLVAIAASNLNRTLDEFVNATQLSVTNLVQMLFAGDSLRYGVFWGHTWVPLTLLLLILPALYVTVRRTGSRASAYHALQVFLPIVGFFAVADPILGIFLPSFEWKQFMTLLPSFFVLLALGVEQWMQGRFTRAGQFFALTLCAFVAYASVVGVQRTWQSSKSPEGRAAKAVRDQKQPGDAIVSLHYSLDAAASFYLANESTFAKPLEEGTTVAFSRTPSVVHEGLLPITRPASLATIREHSRVWILFLPPNQAETVEAITRDCASVSSQSFPPFEVLLVEGCPAFSAIR